MRRCSAAGARSLPANRFLHLVLAEVQPVQAVQRCSEDAVQPPVVCTAATVVACTAATVVAMQAAAAPCWTPGAGSANGCFEEDVQQCLDACPRRQKRKTQGLSENQ